MTSWYTMICTRMTAVGASTIAPSNWFFFFFIINVCMKCVSWLMRLRNVQLWPIYSFNDFVFLCLIFSYDLCNLILCLLNKSLVIFIDFKFGNEEKILRSTFLLSLFCIVIRFDLHWTVNTFPHFPNEILASFLNTQNSTVLVVKKQAKPKRFI